MPIENTSQTETAILNICDNIWTNMENSELSSIICLDLSVAFDTVNHSILLEVMRNYFGITDRALDWISYYLRDRKFSVHIDSFSSNTKTINFSVPQGSILGPTLFNCYVSTLMVIIPENDKNFVSGYADDHALIIPFTQKIQTSHPSWSQTSHTSKTGWTEIN